MKEITIPISALFDGIQKHDHMVFNHNIEYNQKPIIEIQDEYLEFQSVPFLITKEDSIVSIVMDDNTIVETALNHRLIKHPDTKEAVFVSTLKVGDKLTKYKNRILVDTFIKTITILEDKETVFDLNIATSSHLYVDSQGIIHHNTATIEKLALDIIQEKVPKQIAGWEIYSIDVTAMIAGAKFRGDFEKRLKDILKELEEKENCIAFFDEFHTMFGLGANSSNQLDATNILKPAMMNGKIKIMGATTYEEAKNTVDKNKPMARRFQKIDILEPDEETTYEILKGLKKTFAEFHNVSYSDKILKQIVSLTGKHIVDTHFPDKAIDIVDEVGSIIKLATQTTERVAIKEKDIIDLISQKARVPVTIDEGDDKLGLANLETNIKAKLFGQDHAVMEIAEKVMLARAGLNEPGKPMFSYLLAGTSGVGKCLERNTRVKVKVSNELYQEILKNRESA